MRATVDILLATYNGAPYLSEQLASLEAQTWTNWRLHVRDDGSSDASLEILRDWAEQTGRALVVVEDGDTRVGPAESFARLLARSNARYFAFCDQDDVWEPEKLARLVNAAEAAGEGIVLAHCDLAVVDRDLALIASSFWRHQNTDAELRRAAPGHRARLMFHNPVTGCAMLGNAALREAMLPMPEGVSMHDWWAALVAGFRGRIVPVNAPLVRYRQHGGNSVGARTRGLGAMVRRLLTEPAAAIGRTAKVFGTLSKQAGAALDCFGDAMTPQEQSFARALARLGHGLRLADGWSLLIWSLASRRRWPLAAHLVIRTFSR